MILNIELEDQTFLNVDFEDAVYITGPNKKQIWKIFRSLYYYFNKNPQLTSNIYGDNNIELILDGDNLSVKNNNVYFINNRESIYNQMIYKKGSLLFELLNSLQDNIEINYAIENINNENLRLEIAVQKLLNKYSNNLKAEFRDWTYLDILKNQMMMGYEAEDKSFPLEFMDTDILLDEFLNFLEFQLKDNSRTSWLVLYNLDSFISSKDEYFFMRKINELVNQYDLKLIYLGNNLNNVPITVNDLDKIVVSAESFNQLLPLEDLRKSVQMRYPNEFNDSEVDFVNAIKRIVPFVGSNEKLFISGKDLVLLKVVNDILGYGTSFDLEHQLLSSAETKFLKD